MKILYHHRIASKDGQYVHVEEMLKALRGLGHKVIVVGPKVAEEEEFGSEGGWVAKLRDRLPKSIYEFLEFGYSAVAYLQLRKAVLAHRPDCIYERYNLFLPAGVWISKRFNLPMLSEVNAPLFEERSRFGGIANKRLAGWSESYVWNNADKVLPVTEVLAGHVRNTGVADDKIQVIHNGIDPDKFAALDDKHSAKQHLGLEGTEVLGFTGFVRDWHGLDLVLELICQPGFENTSLLLVGDGPARPQLEQQAKKLGVAERFKVTGIVSRDELSKYLSAFDIALQPAAVAYASPLKLFEYMMIDAAIIAPRQDNILEVLSDGKNALLFDPESRTDFRDKLAVLFGDRKLRARLCASARNTVFEDGYTGQSNGKRVEALFRDLLAQNLASNPSASIT